MATVRKSDTVPNNIKVPQIGLGYSKGSFASARSGWIGIRLYAALCSLQR
jgi:hypothetical protein